MKRLLLFICLISGIILTVPVHGDSIEIPDRVSASQDRLLLGDIARVKGGDQGLESISLGYAPYPGHHRWLSRRDVEHALARAGIKDIQLRMNDRILVTRESQIVEMKRIEEAVKAFLASLEKDLEFRILELELPQEILLPEGNAQIRVASSRDLTRLDGVSLRLDFLIDEHRVKSQWVQLRAIARGPVVVAGRDFQYGERVSPADIEVNRRDLTDLDRFVFDVDQITGMTLRRSIRSGDLITVDDVQRPTMVKRGDVVRLIARGRRFAIAALAKARAAGQQGDVILLENLDSKEVVRGRVVGQKLVEIDILEVMQ